MMTHVQATKSFHHSETILEVALRPEDTFTQEALMLSTIPELSPFGDFSSAQDNLGDRLSMISAFSYTEVTGYL